MVRVSVLMLLLTGLPGAAVAGPKLGVVAELGPELDTNATRLHTVPGASEKPRTAGLMRLMARGSLAARLWRRHHLRLMYGAGGKLFWDGEVGDSENEFVHHANAAWAARLPVGTLWVAGSYYDAFQGESRRDFRTGDGQLRLAMAHPGTGARGHLSLSYRGLQYKPDQDVSNETCVETYDPACARYSFHGPGGELGLGWGITTGEGADQIDWRLSLSYAPGIRLYEGLIRGLREKCSDQDPTLAGAAAACAYFKEGQRQDLNHVVRAQLDYQGNADFSLWYMAEINRSNSFGSTYTRHVVGIKFTAELLWRVYLTGKGVLQIRQDRDPLFFGLSDADRNQTFVNIDEENRSSLTIQLARDIMYGASVLVRYGLYVGEAVSQAQLGALDLSPSYLRQTLFAGVRYQYGD